MTASKIGTYQFISVKWPANPMGERLSEITRPGVDGVGYKKEGKRAEPVVIEASVDADDAAATVTWMTNLKALEGTLQTIYDDHGQSFTNVGILEVRRRLPMKVETATGGVSTNKKYLLIFDITVQSTEIA